MKKLPRFALTGILSLSFVAGSLSLPVDAAPAHPEAAGTIRSEHELSLTPAPLPKSWRSTEYRSNLMIVQFDGPIQEEWKEELETLDVELAYYIPDFAYIAKLSESEDREQLTELPFVHSVRPFDPAYKLSPELLKQLDDEKEVKVAVFGFNQDQDVSRTIRKLAPQAESLDKSEVPHISHVSVNAESLKELLFSDDVIAIEPVQERKLRNDVAAGIIQSDELAETGYTGAGQIIGVADTGLDTGKPNAIHPDFAGRILRLYAIGRPGDTSDPHGHGTHVAGSVLGTGAASNGQIKGMAPDAKLVFHSMLTEDGGLAGDVTQILQEAYDDGARIHSDSWGVDDFGEYGSYSAIMDQFLWENKDMTILVAAGNLGDEGPTTVGTPATAKNVIAVGASENIRPTVSQQATGTSKYADDADDVADFSSQGPTADGRIKPDIVAPGSMILSTRSSLASDNAFDLPYNEHYAYMSGTSMAAPVLAGGVAQIRQFLAERGHADPSGALIKAMLLTGAEDLSLPVAQQGFGRANLQAAIETDFIDETDALKTGDSRTYYIHVTDTNQPFVATLVWTDYPSTPIAARTLVNDLNLVVKSPSGKTYNGNDLNGAPDDEVDHLNNVERTYILSPEPGIYTVTVTGFNIPEGPQPYALATSGTFADDADKTVSDLRLSQENLVMQIGQSKQLDAAAIYTDDSEENVTSLASWTSSDEKIVMVDDGFVTAISEGTAVVTAAYKGKSVSAAVTVTNGDDYLEWPAKTNVPATKTWTIRFNQKLDLASVTNKNVYVVDTSGNTIDQAVTVGSDGQSVLVYAPAGNYLKGQQYDLIITDAVRSSSGKQLKQAIRMTFTIRP
ncbi:MAG: S8 family serine peptidase [Brevibacillus sp.]|nr:S8 family serine peptidase [Brevibacillus sp.]